MAKLTKTLSCYWKKKKYDNYITTPWIISWMWTCLNNINVNCIITVQNIFKFIYPFLMVLTFDVNDFFWIKYNV